MSPRRPSVPELGDLVVVKWLDAVSEAGWTDPAKVDGGLMQVVTVGFLVHRDERTLALAQSVTGDGDAGSVWTVPLSWVVEERSVTWS